MSAVVLVAIGVALTLLAAALLWPRPRDRRVAVMLLALAAAYGLRAFAASDVAWVFTLARALGQVAEILLVWVMLAFPSGRLHTRIDRLLVLGAGVTCTVLWWGTLLTSELSLTGPLVPCDSDCPDNLLMVTDASAASTAFEVAFRAGTVLVLAAVAVRLLQRLVGASRLVRRTLAPLLVVSTLRVVALAVFVASAGSWLSGVALTMTFWAVPLAMALGLLLGRLYVARAMLGLVSGLERRPDERALRQVMAEALDDPELELVYWLPDAGHWAHGDGRVLPGPPVAERGRAVSVVEGAEGPLAAVVVDEVILEEPTLLEAVTASARIALESNRAEMRVRRDLERDLHDGAQQRLIALRMKVSVLTRLLDQDVRRAAELVQELGPDLDAALAEVRDLAHGQRPRGLDGGLGEALTRITQESGLAASIELRGLGRYPDDVEAAVYFACREALQNAAKHAGPDARVEVVVHDDGSSLVLEVSDDGSATSDPSVDGQGIGNMAARFAAHGGVLTVRPRPTGGVVVRGVLPHS